MRTETRVRNLVATTADYLTTIYELQQNCGEARKQDLARIFSTSHVTVLKTIERLKKEGLVKNEAYRAIFLTEDGERTARDVLGQREVVERLLVSYGVTTESALLNARRIVALLSEDVIDAIQNQN